MVDNARVNYLCQRCQQPLRLDSSLLSLDEHTLAELSLPITPTPTHHHQLLSQVYLPITPTHHLYSLGSSIGGHVSPLLVFLITASTSTLECCRPASMSPAVMGSCFSFVLLYTGRLTGPPGAAGPPQ